MTSLDDLLRVHGRLTTVHVERWVARGLLRPTAEGDGWAFETVDVARARLLAELADEMGFDDEAVETVIDLVDQVHTLRRQLHQLGQAIGRQPAETREAIALALKDSALERWERPLAGNLPEVSRLPTFATRPRWRRGRGIGDHGEMALVGHDRHADARIDRLQPSAGTGRH